MYGSGEKFLFCFHGYGENAESFSFLETLLGKGYRFISIDLPFHGSTKWEDGLLFTPNDLIDIIQALLLLLPSPTGGEGQGVRFSLLGYSMGGRVALQLLQLFPHEIEQVVLIAPDGLHKNFWYWFSTQTWMGNKLFAFTMKHPGLLFGLMNTAGKLNLLNKSIVKIAHYYLDDANERALLYKRWITMRKFRPHLYSIKSVIKQNKIPVRFLFGKYDQIILSKRSNFLKEDKENIQVQVIEAGHQLLKEKYASEIVNLFYQ